ncbi:MAG: tRNA (5-methylaminomethyl-2-thiouridylate)-methyltransferase [Bacteroidetes bacterium]|nr:tRNA (5-methylaminomethyl-2-thiouridylate)-methyltransferase [Bacteroidota bacterium]
MATIKQLQTTLRITYGVVPIVAGLDKFTNLLANWPDYLGNMKGMLPLDALLFMKIVGVIEIVAGIIVLARPLIGAYIVMAWLTLIALQLLIFTHYYDVAVRDLVMAVGAFTLAQLTRINSENHA